MAVARSKRDNFGRDVASLGGLLSKLLDGQQIPDKDSDVSAAIANAVEKLAESKKDSDNVSILKNLVKKESAFSELNEAGLTLKDLLEMRSSKEDQLMQVLEKERQARLKAEEKLLEARESSSSSEATATQSLFGMLLETLKMQHAQSNRFEESGLKDELRSLKEDLAKLREKPEEKPEDEMTKAIKESQAFLITEAIQSLVKREPVDPLTQIQTQASELSKLRELFGGHAGEDSRLQIELKKIEYEDRWRREQLISNRELEERKLQNMNRLLEQFQTIAPAVIETLVGKGAIQADAIADQPSSRVTESSNLDSNEDQTEAWCIHCGREINLNDAECSFCGEDLALDNDDEADTNVEDETDDS